jgi:hypothetical protein
VATGVVDATAERVRPGERDVVVYGRSVDVHHRGDGPEATARRDQDVTTRYRGVQAVLARRRAECAIDLPARRVSEGQGHVG